MGMIMQYVRIRDDELVRLRDLLTDDPDQAYDYVDELADADADDGPPEHSRSIDTDKAWHAMAYLLDRAGPAPVDVIHGGARMTIDEWGYDSPRYLPPEEVARAAQYLGETPFSRLAQHYDPAAMADVYPNVWGRGDVGLDYVRGWYESLVQFFAHAAAHHDGMVVYLT